MKFKCAESDEHVKHANIQRDDVQAIIDFGEHFDIPMPTNTVEFRTRLFCAKTTNEFHDMAHQLMDDLVAAADAGNPVMSDEMFAPIIDEMRQKQKECRHNV